VREALRLTLTLLDMEVACYGSAKEFLAAHDPSREACLVVDLKLPETTGLELLNILRELDPVLPVIVISGHASGSDAVQAMKTGAIEFLEKPYVISTLRESVTKALQIRRFASQEDGPNRRPLRFCEHSNHKN
jgi:two-component system response regulator FixJ